VEPFQNSEVAAQFDAYPELLRQRLLDLRQLIFDTASAIEDVGQLQETLKWGQPSYLTHSSKSGTTIRIGQIKSKPGGYGLYVHCQTSLLATYRELYPNELRYVGARCIEFTVNDEMPREPLRHCIALALTYHRNKKCKRASIQAGQVSQRDVKK